MKPSKKEKTSFQVNINNLTRFFKYVQKTSFCWMWTGSKNIKGYGCFGYKTKYGFKIIGSHRASYYLFKGLIKKDHHILHICDNPSCVNPNHLKQGTNMDNVKDRVSKNRNADARGERNGRSILNDDKVYKIRILYKSKKYTQQQIADLFGVTDSTIGMIINHKRWK